ncbi:MAG TPA: sterol desaturase family protein [bacterium]|nr:sterol desaturase family protein [bacterium]
MNVIATATVSILLIVPMVPILPRSDAVDSMWFSIPAMLRTFLGVLLLDLTIYWYHRLTHLIPVAWQFHRMHHTDFHLDGSTAVRFHPMEVLFSMCFVFPLSFMVGLPVVASEVYLLLQPVITIFHHADIDVGEKWDKIIRCIVVSPRMHHLHHSQDVRQMNRNFGIIFTFWDRIFGTYERNCEPETIKSGLKKFMDEEWQTIDGMLATPFKRGPSSPSGSLYVRKV